MGLRIDTLINPFSNCYLFAKNQKGEYLFVMLVTEIAGLDFPGQIVGKKDHELYWLTQAASFQAVAIDLVD